MTENNRFEFGKNWENFLTLLDEDRIAAAEQSILKYLKLDSLNGLRILDIGSGSGLFSLAAYRLGAEIISIDCDQSSVRCTEKLREIYATDSTKWMVIQGSALDAELLDSLGKFDGVYSWGVLHHTGDMNTALNLTAKCVKENGWLFIAIYNDQGGASRRWLKVKQLYNLLPTPIRKVYVFIIAVWHEAQYSLKRMLRGQSLFLTSQDRGMNAWVDWIDWVGGLPFEFAKPEQIIIPMRDKGFILDFLKTQGRGWGCNEFVFRLDSGKAISEL